MKSILLTLLFASVSVFAEDTHSVLVKKGESRSIDLSSKSGTTDYFMVSGISDDERVLVLKMGGQIIEDPTGHVTTKIQIPANQSASFEAGLSLLADARANAKLGCAVKAALKCEGR